MVPKQTILPRDYFEALASVIKKLPPGKEKRSCEFQFTDTAAWHVILDGENSNVVEGTCPQRDLLLRMSWSTFITNFAGSRLSRLQMLRQLRNAPGQSKIEGDRSVMIRLMPFLREAHDLTQEDLHFKNILSRSRSSPSLRSTPTSVAGKVSNCDLCGKKFGLLTKRHSCLECRKQCCSACVVHAVKGASKLCVECGDGNSEDTITCEDKMADTSFEADNQAMSPDSLRAYQEEKPVKVGIVSDRLEAQIRQLGSVPVASETITEDSADGRILSILKSKIKSLEDEIFYLQRSGHGIQGSPLLIPRTLGILGLGILIGAATLMLVTGPVQNALDAPAPARGAWSLLSFTTTKSQETYAEAATSAISEYAHGAVSYLQSLSLLTLVTSGIVGSMLITVLALRTMLANTLFARQFRVMLLAFRVIGAYWFLRKRCQYMKPLQAQEDEWYETAHRKYSVIVYNDMVKLRGLWVKAGQFMSSRADVVPDTWIKALRGLQDAVPFDPFEEIRTTLEQELQTDVGDVFEEVSEKPLAAASIAQVHRATLHGERHVVIKVQHKNIQEIIKQDLNNMATIMGIVAYLEPEFDFRPIVNEWSTEAMRELDFRNESRRQILVKNNMEKAGLNVIIPEIFEKYTTDKILVMDFVEGFKITDEDSLKEHGVDRISLVQRVCQAYANQLFVDGVFNADPHPGNILVHVENGHATPVLLDFGLCKELSSDKRLAFARMIQSASDMDYGGLMASFEEMGLRLNREDPTYDMEQIRYITRDTQPPAIVKKEMAAFKKLKQERQKQQPLRKRNPIDAWPGELVFFFRVIMLLRGLCSGLHIRLPYLRVMSPYAKLAMVRKWKEEFHAKQVVTNHSVNGALGSTLASLMRREYFKNMLTGFQVYAFKDGEPIVSLSSGTLGNVDPRPVQEDTLFNVFSVTKAVAAAALHVLIQDGHARYDDKISKYWPEFAQKGKEDITIEQALCHQAGLNNAASMSISLEKISDWEHMVSLIAEAQPAVIGKSYYHYLSFGWLVGGIVERIGPKKHIRDIVYERFAVPLGISDELYLGLPKDRVDYNEYLLQGRIATLCNGFGSSGQAPSPEELQQMIEDIRNEMKELMGADSAPPPMEDATAQMVDPCIFNSRTMRQSCIPAANGHFSARGLATFYNWLCSEDNRPLARDMMEPAKGNDKNAMLQWGRGVRLYKFQNDGKEYMGFGHTGMAGSIGLCCLS
eukprot:Clim_evm12s47 gene=Clim_evmTU12s47